MSEPPCRRYDSPLRRERANATHERIVDAGCTVLAASSVGAFENLPIRVP